MISNFQEFKDSSKLEEYQILYNSYSHSRLLELEHAVEYKYANRAEMEEFQTLISFERIRTFTNFVKSMNYEIDYQWFHWLLMEVIDEMIASNHSRRLMIELPPRHCKTLIAGVFLCTYLFGRFMDKCIIYATANNEKAVSEASNMRNVITSERYQQLFPGAKVKTSIEDVQQLSKRDRKSKKDTATLLSNLYSSRGEIRVGGMGDMLSGHPGHFLVADDLYKGYAEAQSDKVRENIWQWFWTVFLSRADKSSVGGCAHGIVFFTRWHDDDICGRIQRTMQEQKREILEIGDRKIPWIDWEIFSFEAIKTENKVSHPSDPRKPGDPLWKIYEPEYYSHKLLNPIMFEAIYQGNPINKLGQLFERHYFQEYETLPKEISRIIIAIDPNLKEVKESSSAKSTSNNFAIVVLGIYNDRIYLIDWVSKSKDYQSLKIETMGIIRKYPHYWACVIEQTASGPALTSDLRQYVGRIVEFAPGSVSKYEKTSLIMPTFIDGKYYVPNRATRADIDVFINQHIGFTGEKGRHDDLVDANVIGLLYYLQNKCISNISFVSTMNNSPVRNLMKSPPMSLKTLLPRYKSKKQNY